MSTKLVDFFDEQSEIDFLIKAGSICASLNQNENFPEPWDPATPSLAELNKAYRRYKENHVSASCRDASLIALSVTSRESLTAILQKIADYLESVADGDIQALMSTGYDLRRDIMCTSSHSPFLRRERFIVSRANEDDLFIVKTLPYPP